MRGDDVKRGGALVDWPKHDDTLRQMWRAGRTSTEIAATIPNATRSGVLGRVSRLNLTRDAGVPARKAASKSPVHPKAERRHPVRLTTVVAVVAKRRPPILTPAPAPVVVAAVPRETCFVASGRATVPLKQLRATSCRWPFDGEPTTYCGAATHGARVYCPAHAQLAYAPSAERHGRPRP